MATIYYDKDANPELIKNKKVAVIGFGSQGHAHALNLRDSGVEVRVSERPGCEACKRALEQGFELMETGDAVAWADTTIILAPDTTQPKIYKTQIEPNLDLGKTLMFAHGFNIRYGTIVPPPEVDVSMVAPKAPGHRLRELYVEGAGTPALMAVHQNPSGMAKENAIAYAWGIGVTRAGVVETTFSEETETDLFGEQAVLCGGVTALLKAGFETLVEAGYQPELAYFETMHELKLIVDLMYQGGMNYMRYSVSDTAEHGDYTAGEQIIGEEARYVMSKLLKDIQDGTYARNWIEENEKGRPWFNEKRRQEQKHMIERVGADLRKMMPFVNPIEIKPGE
ncbi:MAG: ketol-acid reductoisomerase [Anaerolineales bacterium]|jgi:ketol-acid reductoisomerase